MRTKINTWGCTWLCLCDEYYSSGKPKTAKWPKVPQLPEAVIYLMSTAARKQIPPLPSKSPFIYFTGDLRSAKLPKAHGLTEGNASSSTGQPRQPINSKATKRSQRQLQAANTTACKSCQRARNCLWENITYP